MDIEIDISQAIKDLRSKAKLTQIQIAKELGCTQANVSYLQNTKAPRARPTAKVEQGIKRLLAQYSSELAA